MVLRNEGTKFRLIRRLALQRAAIRLMSLIEPRDEAQRMSTAETVSVIVVVGLILLAIGNIVFSVLSERNNPPVGSFTECDGVRLHYLDCGDPAAPCVVLFHGNGSMIQDFMTSGLVDRLARRNRVLCFDRPGFGYSRRPRSRIWTATAQAALFVKALNQLGVRNPVVLGHSWGALVAIAIGLRNDYPIRGLVLASGYFFPTWRWDVWMMSSPRYRYWAIWYVTQSPRSFHGPFCPHCFASFSHLALFHKSSKTSFRLR
jgi:pimeloyl-ACP methyl ester carboxylesterase